MPGPRPGPRPTLGPRPRRPSGGGASGQRSAPVRPRRRRRHGLADQRGRRAHHRLLAGRRHRSGVRPLRPAIRRPEHRDHAAWRSGWRRAPATPARSKPPPSALAETLPTANVLGDVDALAARLAGIAEHADAAAAADRSRRDEHRAAQTARKEALAAEAEELAATSTQWKVAGDRLRAILDEWKTISGLDRKTDDALWKRYSAARETFNRRRGSHFAELDRERAGVPRGQGAALRAGRGAVRLDGLGRHQRRVPQAARPTGRPPDARPAMSTTPCGTASRPPRTRSSRPATPRPPSETPNSRPTPPPRRRCWPRRKSSTPATTKPPGRRCGRSATSGTRSARFRGNGRPSSSGGCARSRRRCATPASRTGPTRRLRPAPSSSASVPSSTSARPRRPRRPAAPRRPKRPGPTPSSGGSGLTPPPRR